MRVKSEVKSLSRVRLLATPWTAVYQAPLPMGFSRQQYWSGLPVPSPMINLASILKKQRYYFANKGPSSQGYGLSSSHVCMWELDCEESWVLKYWCFWTMVLDKTVESSLDCKEIQPVHSKGDQPWVFFGRNDAKAETPVLWLPRVKSWLIGKDSDAGRDWGQEEKGMTEDEMAGWHHWLDGCESVWTPGDGDGQGGLACCDSWGRKELDMTERLNWLTENLLKRRCLYRNASTSQDYFPGLKADGTGKNIKILDLYQNIINGS